STVIPDGPVPCAVFPLGIRRSVVRVQGAEGGGVGVGRVARDAGFDGVPVIDLEGQLARIVIASGVAIDEWASRKKARAKRRLEVRVILGGIESAEEEEAIPQ